MSKSLESQVWQSALDPELKPLAAVMADMGNDDGFGIYPSVEYLAWLLGRSERAIQMGLKKLVARGVLDRTANQNGGRGLTPRYRFNVEALPERPSWKETRKGATVAPFQKGAIYDEKGATNDQKGATVAPDPLVDPLVDPITPLPPKPKPKKNYKSPEPEVEPEPPFHSEKFLDALGAFERHRKALRRPLTGDARILLYLDIEEMGEHAAIEGMKLAVKNGYLGIKYERGSGNSNNGNGHGKVLCDPDRPIWMAGQPK